MQSPEQRSAAALVLRMLISDLEQKIAFPEHYTPREREQQRQLLNVRRLELADLLDQEADAGDLP